MIETRRLKKVVILIETTKRFVIAYYFSFGKTSQKHP